MFNLGQIFMTIGAHRDGKLQPARCASCGICYGRYPHTDHGMDVRPIFHKLRLLANENFNEHYNDIFDGHGQIPTNGLLALSDLH